MMSRTDRDIWVIRVQTTLDLYTDEGIDEMIATQKTLLTPWDSKPGGPVKDVGEIVGKLEWKRHS